MSRDKNFFGAFEIFNIPSFVRRLRRVFESDDDYSKYSFDHVCKSLKQRCENRDESILECLKSSQFWTDIKDFQRTQVSFENDDEDFRPVATAFFKHFFKFMDTRNFFHKRIQESLKKYFVNRNEAEISSFVNQIELQDKYSNDDSKSKTSGCSEYEDAHSVTPEMSDDDVETPAKRIKLKSLNSIELIDLTNDSSEDERPQKRVKRLRKKNNSSQKILNKTSEKKTPLADTNTVEKTEIIKQGPTEESTLPKFRRSKRILLSPNVALDSSESDEFGPVIKRKHGAAVQKTVIEKIREGSEDEDEDEDEEQMKFIFDDSDNSSQDMVPETPEKDIKETPKKKLDFKNKKKTLKVNRNSRISYPKEISVPDIGEEFEEFVQVAFPKSTNQTSKPVSKKSKAPTKSKRIKLDRPKRNGRVPFNADLSDDQIGDIWN